jgi:uncharacterized protein YerC
MNQSLKKEIEKSLAKALKELKDEKEILEFLNNFLTEKELEILSKRLAIIYWLAKKRTVENIENNLKVSKKLVKETSPLLKKKPIQNIIKKIDADVWAEKWSQKIKGLVKSP